MSKRDKVAQNLGFKSFDGYMMSSMCKIVKDMVHKRDHGKCKFCTDKATTVKFEQVYLDALVGKKLSDIVSVCEKHNRQ